MQQPGFSKVVAVTPSDTVNVAGLAPKSLWVGGAGNVSVVMNGQTVTFTGVVAGTLLPIITARVRATGTTATNILMLGD